MTKWSLDHLVNKPGGGLRGGSIDLLVYRPSPAPSAVAGGGVRGGSIDHGSIDHEVEKTFFQKQVFLPQNHSESSFPCISGPTDHFSGRKSQKIFHRFFVFFLVSQNKYYIYNRLRCCGGGLRPPAPPPRCKIKEFWYIHLQSLLQITLTMDTFSPIYTPPYPYTPSLPAI